MTYSVFFVPEREDSFLVLLVLQKKNGWNKGWLDFYCMKNTEARPRAASNFAVKFSAASPLLVDRTLSSSTWQLIFNFLPVLISFRFLPLKLSRTVQTREMEERSKSLSRR